MRLQEIPSLVKTATVARRKMFALSQKINN